MWRCSVNEELDTNLSSLHTDANTQGRNLSRLSVVHLQVCVVFISGGEQHDSNNDHEHEPRVMLWLTHEFPDNEHNRTTRRLNDNQKITSFIPLIAFV